MPKIVIMSEQIGSGDAPIAMGEAQRLYDFGGDWTKAIGRLFLEKKPGFEVSIKYEDGSVVRFYLKKTK